LEPQKPRKINAFNNMFAACYISALTEHIKLSHIVLQTFINI